MSVKKAAETVNPPKAAEPEEDFGPDEDELAAMEAAQAADMAAMGKLFEADDKLSAAFAEIKRLNAEVAQLKLSRDGYMNKSNELISMVKSLQRKLERAQKAAA
jgi:RNA:NAD 2'-phosphotransferase (TPT1/KptA family)